MWFYNGAISETMDKVGFRLKGGASRSYVKKSFKLSFNEFVDGFYLYFYYFFIIFLLYFL